MSTSTSTSETRRRPDTMRASASDTGTVCVEFAWLAGRRVMGSKLMAGLWRCQAIFA